MKPSILFLLCATAAACANESELLAEEQRACIGFVGRTRTLECGTPEDPNSCNPPLYQGRNGRSDEEIIESTDDYRCRADNLFCDGLGFATTGDLCPSRVGNAGTE